MKKILLALVVLFSINANAQTWSTLTQGSRYTYNKFLGVVGSDSGNIIGSVSSLTNCHLNSTFGSLVAFGDSLYFRSATKWINLSRGGSVVGNTIYTGNGTLSSDRFVNGNTHKLEFDDISYYNINANRFNLFDTVGYPMLTINDSSTNIHSPHFYITGIIDTAISDTSRFKPLGLDYNGVVVKMDKWYGGGSATNYWTATGTDIVNNNSGKVTIGQNSTSRLTVDSAGSLNWYSNDPYFNLDGTNRRFQLGDYTYDWYGTSIDLNDDNAAKTINYRAYGGHNFVGGRISSESDLSLMNGNAGIFSNGSFSTYDSATGNNALYSAGSGDLYVADKVSGNNTYLTDGIGNFYIKDKITNLPTLYTDGNGDLTLIDKGNGDTSLIINNSKFKVIKSAIPIAYNKWFLNYDTITGQVYRDTIAAGNVGTVTAVMATAPLLYTNSTTTPNITADTGRGNNQLSTGGDLIKVSDSLGAIIATKGSGTVTNVATGYGLTGGTITTTGTLKVDSATILPLSSITLNTSGTIHNTPVNFSRSGGAWSGTLSLATQSAYKVFWNNTNSTTTPAFNYLDSNAWNGSFATQVRNAQTNTGSYLPLSGGTLTSRLTGTSLILNKDSLPTVTGKTWGLVVDTTNSNRISRQVLNTGTVTSVAALTIGTSGTNITSTVATGTTTPVITLNVPDASATARGVVTTGTQTFAGAKTFSGDIQAGSGAGALYTFANSAVRVGTGAASTNAILNLYGGSGANSNVNLYSDVTFRGSWGASSGGGVYIRGAASTDNLVLGNTAIGISQMTLVGSSGNLLVGTTTDAASTDKIQASGNLNLITAGNKIKIATGTNASIGTSTLSSGTVTVSTTAVTASSIILLTLQNCSTCGTPYISAKTAGTSFVITSTNVLDGSIVAYQIIN